jgi:prophage DNA circulation protein
MKKTDVMETIPMLTRVMEALLATVQAHGREGSDVRRAVGDLLAHSPQLLGNDEAGAPIALCFDTAVAAVNDPARGVISFYEVLMVAKAEAPVTAGAILTKYSLIQFCLGAICQVMVDVEFKTRQNINAIRDRLNETFAIVEEAAADAMDSMTYRVLVELHSSIINFLVETARPLPRLLSFHFVKPMTTLVASYRLYDTAIRCDELRAENRVVHPAFMRQDGLALSF